MPRYLEALFPPVSHYIDKLLGPLVHDAILRAAVGHVVSPAPASVMEFIERLEDEEVALVREFLGNLLPHGLEFCGNRLIFSG